MPEADEILRDPAVLLRHVGEAWEIYLLGGSPGLSPWDAIAGDGFADLLAQTPDGGPFDFGGSPLSHHEALRRAAMETDARDVFAAAVLHPHAPGIRRRAPDRSERYPGQSKRTAYLAVILSSLADTLMPLLFAAVSVVLLPGLAGVAAVFALLLLGDTRPLLPAGLSTAGLVLAALLVPLAGAGLRARAARIAGQNLLGEAERLGADLPVHVLWIPGEAPTARVPADASSHLHLATAAAVAAFSPPNVPASWARLSRRVLAAHPRGGEARHGILRLPDSPRLVRVVPRPDGTLFLLDGP